MIQQEFTYLELLNTYPFNDANFWKDDYVYCRVEFFSEDLNFVISEQADLRINGGVTRTYPQKSFKLTLDQNTQRFKLEFV